jgi:glycosyltransferase involved in cell wall biosynthesis
MTSRQAGDPEISVIVPVCARNGDVLRLYEGYKAGLDSLGKPCEFIFVLDGDRAEAAADLQQLLTRGENLVVMRLTRAFGEASALMAGFQRARGSTIVTLPAYHQIEGSDVTKLIGALDRADLAIACRTPRRGSRFEAMRRAGFHKMIASVTGQRYRDLGCGARAMKRRVAEEIALYGDQHRFLPLLAHRLGFRVAEIEVRQSKRDWYDRGYRSREYVHRVLDIFTVFFLVRFTKKPLRFFGMLGASTFMAGVLLTSWLVIERLFLDRALADRPALLLSSLLVVLGMQVFALGLLGELIIFTHARDIKDYQIDKVIRYDGADQPTPLERSELISDLRSRQQKIS